MKEEPFVNPALKFCGLMAAVLALAYMVCSLSACSTAERTYRSQKRAKDKIDRLLSKHPSLLKSSSDTVRVVDTLVRDNTIVRLDTVVIPEYRLDTVLYGADGVFSFDNPQLSGTVTMRDGTALLNITRRDIAFVHYDTFRYYDTVVIDRTRVIETNTVQSATSFWWEVWLFIKSWFWILMLVAVLMLIGLVIIKRL